MARSRITSPISGTLLEVSEKYEGDEVKLNEWINRPKIQKLGENLCSLMAQVL